MQNQIMSFGILVLSRWAIWIYQPLLTTYSA